MEVHVEERLSCDISIIVLLSSLSDLLAVGFHQEGNLTDGPEQGRFINC